ncbi:peptidylprolyl isomerase [Kangiella koreensis]|uniref:peptidylprolyl isomerase n=1 Tax=Kangiella koreensis (strain DSM 16069 / JCM 12317 / KCTC 12182 / SW-125) TaxID=523791 RepID=C7RBW0_KANKD|nr:peptidylprolyl isomerase [Kangiella koreensis]ACV26752.1 PpiC-type peptidyl-prolyl cis-trans isomerase [Kangiella koreensis DSM 16069]
MSTAATYKPTKQDQKAPFEVPVISVNGELIDEKLLSEELQYHPAQDAESAIQKAGQALVIRQLLKQQLKESATEIDDEEQAFQDLIENNINYQEVSDEDCQRYYEQNQAKFMTAPIMEVSHILLAVAPDDIEGRIEKKTVAEKLISKLLKDSSLFTDMVIEYSGCPSNKTGGSLGQISKGQTVPEFERQLFPLDEGIYDKPIESRYGYHIVFINKKIDGNQLEYSMVSEKIHDYLNVRRHRQAVSDYLYQLVEDSTIEGLELKLEQDNIFFG